MTGNLEKVAEDGVEGMEGRTGVDDGPSLCILFGTILTFGTLVFYILKNKKE